MEAAAAVEVPSVAVEVPSVAVEVPNVAVEVPNVAVEAPNVAVEAPNVAVEAPNVAVEVPTDVVPEQVKGEAKDEKVETETKNTEAEVEAETGQAEATAEATADNKDAKEKKEEPMMRAAWTDRYGDPAEVVSVKEVPRPKLADDKILIRVQASAVHAGDWHLIRGTPKVIRLMFGGLRKPTKHILGMDVAGVVEQVGKNVTDFSVGDHVFGDVSECGMGAWAEYICVPPSAVVERPENVSLFQAAGAGVSAISALQAVRDVARVKKGDKVLVNGGASGVGHFVIQIAKGMGAEVTAVCRKEKMDVCKNMGADVVLDYTETDILKAGDVYDVFIDMAGYRSASEVAPVIKKSGTYVFVGGDDSRFFKTMFGGTWIGMRNRIKVKCLATKVNGNDLKTVRGMLERNELKVNVDKTFKLDQIVEAVKYVEDRKAAGKVIIDVSQ